MASPGATTTTTVATDAAAVTFSEPLVPSAEDDDNTDDDTTQAIATPKRFLYWGLFAQTEGMVLFCLAMMALCIAFVSMREMVLGLSPEDVKEGDTPGFVLLVFIVSSLVVVMLFLFRVWRKHSRQQRALFKQQQKQLNSISNNNHSETTARDQEYALAHDTESTIWIFSLGHLVRHTAIEFMLASSWALAIVIYAMIRNVTIKDNLPTWADLGIAYVLLFIMYSVCVRWYNPVQRCSQKLADLKIPTGRELLLMMFHLGCASLAFHCFTVLVDDMQDNFGWVVVQFLTILIGLAFLSSLIPKLP